MIPSHKIEQAHKAMDHIIETIKAVREMREAQKNYFKNCLPADLNNAKRLEKRVDELLDR